MGGADDVRPAPLVSEEADTRTRISQLPSAAPRRLTPIHADEGARATEAKLEMLEDASDPDLS